MTKTNAYTRSSDQQPKPIYVRGFGHGSGYGLKRGQGALVWAAGMVRVNGLWALFLEWLRLKPKSAAGKLIIGFVWAVGLVWVIGLWD